MQVLINLLSNANKFCESGRGQVAIRLLATPREYRVEVEDNGLGIPRHELGRIFEKFHQVSDSRAGRPKGSGLGLAISQRIVEHHGGRIWVESEVGRGATFAFTLPRARATDAA
jgi:signal transduction histidine kinase